MGPAPASLYFAEEDCVATNQRDRTRGAERLLMPTTSLRVRFESRSLAWSSPSRGTARWESGSFTPRRVGLDHLAFGVADEAELEEWRGRLDELGIAHGDIDDYGYGLAITLRDPDGIALEFICPPRKAPASG